MKHLITCLAFATLVAGGGFAFQKAKIAEAPSLQENARHQFEKRVQNVVNQQIKLEGVSGKKTVVPVADVRAERRAEMRKRMAAKSVKPVAQAAAAPVSAPFKCDFETEESFTENWTVIDGNGDTYSWEYDQYGYAPLKVVSVWCGDYGGDDYLVTRNPVSLGQGEAHVLFDYCSMSAYYNESMEVLYGTSTDVDEMQQIGQYVDFTTPSSTEPSKAIVNFDVPTAGDYYFAIHYNPSEYQWGMWIDNVEIDEGRFVGTPDIAITAVTLPEPDIELSASEKVSVTVANQGTCAVASYSLSWTAECNGSSQTGALQTITEPLQAGASATVEMDMPVNMAGEGAYAVTVTVSNVVPAEDGNAETETSNNVMSAVTAHFGVTDVPFETDFAEGAQYERWASTSGWTYVGETLNCMVCVDPGSLVSCGVNLEAGKSYKFNYVYMAGYYDPTWGDMISESFDVRYGKVGGDMETIDYVTNNTGGSFVTGEETITCEESGVYQFAIAQDYYPGGSLCISSISITEANDYDLSIQCVQPGYPTMIPEAQVGGSILANVAIKNEGRNSCSGTLSYTVGDAAGQQVDIPEIAAGDTIVVPVEFMLPAGAEAGTSVDIEFSVSLTGHADNDEGNNSATAHIAITEEVLAYDQVKEYDEMNAIGSPYGAMMLGLPIHLDAEDILTGISAGWGYADGQDIRLAVYEFDPDNYIEQDGMMYYLLGEELYLGTAPQGTAMGQVTYDIDPKVLAPGDYMICVEYADYCMVVDNLTPGILYSVADGIAVNQSNLGVPALRAMFGQTKARNLTVDGITSLTDAAVFASNQPVVVQLTNNGSESATGVVEVTVNGETIGQQNISLEPFTTGSCTFEADLSAVGKYEIVASVAFDEDEVPEDNSAEMTVECIEALDPYVMDFEGCADYSINWFNPVWTTVDGDGHEAYGVSGISFPIPAGGVGFMAFNPYNTYPSMVEYLPYTVPCSGERYGITFYSNNGEANDDWLISPLLKMPAEGAKVTMQVQSFDDLQETALEEYEVCVSTTDNLPESFTVVYSGEAPAEEWTEVSVDLGKYNGQDIYVAIHCVSKDVFFFMIDDIVVSKPTSGVDNVAATGVTLALYPNPASETVVIAGQGVTGADFYSMAGVQVGSAAASAAGEVRYDVSGLAPGIYVAKIATPTGVEVKRFIVK